MQIKNAYQFCSTCGANLKKDKYNNLACVKCSFVNYRNARPTATALIVLDNRILLVKRHNVPFKGWWDLPGGFVDRGETFEEAMRRELSEELELKIRKIKFFGHFAGTYRSPVDSFHIITAVFIVTPRGKNISVLDSEELTNVKWFLKKKLPGRIAFDSNQKIIKAFLKTDN